MGITVDGIVNVNSQAYAVPITFSDTVDASVRASYMELIQNLQGILAESSHVDPSNPNNIIPDPRYFTTGVNAGLPDPAAFSASFLSAISTLAQLNTLAVYGQNGKFLSTTLAADISLMSKTLQSAGITLPNFVVDPGLSQSQNIANYNAALNAYVQNKIPGTSLPPINFVNGDGTYTTTGLPSTADINALNTLLSAPANYTNIANNIISPMVQWGNLAGFGVAQVFAQAAADTKQSARTLQSLIELEYVKSGNDIIFGALTGLETALTTTQSAIASLTQLQQVKNLQTINQVFFNQSQFSPFVYNPATGTIAPSWATSSDFVQAYTSAGNTYFNLRYPSISGLVSAGGKWQQTALQMIGLISQLKTQVQTLGSISPNASKGIPGTLAANLQSVIGNLSRVFTGNSRHILSAGDVINVANSANVKAALKDWILDGVVANSSSPTGVTNPNLSQTGVIQNNLTQAINTAQNLNDTQKQKVSNYLFLFQEFYKSASSVLQTITNIITKMADGINK